MDKKMTQYPKLPAEMEDAILKMYFDNNSEKPAATELATHSRKCLRLRQNTKKFVLEMKKTSQYFIKLCSGSLIIDSGNYTPHVSNLIKTTKPSKLLMTEEEDTLRNLRMRPFTVGGVYYLHFCVSTNVHINRKFQRALSFCHITHLVIEATWRGFLSQLRGESWNWVVSRLRLMRIIYSCQSGDIINKMRPCPWDTQDFVDLIQRASSLKVLAFHTDLALCYEQREPDDSYHVMPTEEGYNADNLPTSLFEYVLCWTRNNPSGEKVYITHGIDDGDFDSGFGDYDSSYLGGESYAFFREGASVWKGKEIKPKDYAETIFRRTGRRVSPDEFAQVEEEDRDLYVDKTLQPDFSCEKELQDGNPNYQGRRMP